MPIRQLLNASEMARIIHRPGDHHGFDDVNTYFDWFDKAFERLTTGLPLGWSGPAGGDFPLTFLTPAGFSWEQWNKSVSPAPPIPSHSMPLTDRVEWLLASEATDAPTGFSPGATYAEETLEFVYISDMLHHRAELDVDSILRQPLSFGDYVTGNAFFPKQHRVDLISMSNGGLPVIIWLHPYSYATGYTATYGQAQVWEHLTTAGFIVITYDQVGFGIRLPQGGTSFYARYGNKASLFGHMVKDARAAIDLAYCLSAEGRQNVTCQTGQQFTPTYPDQLVNIPNTDPNRIFVMGYSLGGNVALHVAAMDARVAAVGAFAAFTPYRTDSNDRPTGGIARLYDLQAILPRLGYFAERPQDIPYDYDELLGSIAPRPMLLHTPMRDRDATFVDVNQTVAKVALAYQQHGASAALNHSYPDTMTQMTLTETALASEWAVAVAKSLLLTKSVF